LEVAFLAKRQNVDAFRRRIVVSENRSLIAHHNAIQLDAAALYLAARFARR
jgi:hypothetical protein